MAQWLAELGLGTYAANFIENEIDASILPDLTDQSLKDLGVALVGHRLKILRAVAQLSAPVAAQAQASSAPIADPSPLQPVQDGRKPASIGERRHLTVMFCDLVGSTALAARLDPEDVREVVRAYQSACARVIARYEGFVAQYLGDGIMAYFGYPAAHEDEAERAVRAGLELVAAVARLDTKTKVEVRVGIATGLVVVGDLIGEQGAKERAVTGETPNLAARLQGLATPGSILVSTATRRLLGGMFELRDLGTQSVKGLDAPVTAFAVEGVLSFESRFEARAGGLTGFVGREEECEHLLDRWKLARQGRGQVVLVSGEAGIGKSRLTAWLVDKVLAEPHTRMRYQCTPHHKDSALYPTIAQIERAAGIEANELGEAKLAKLEALLALAETEAAETVPLFAALLAIPTGEKYPPLAMSPGQQRQRTLAAMLDQIEGLARQKPLLMIYEDAHWADATSLELLDTLVDRLARLPALFVVTGRPEFSPAWAGRHNVSTLYLQKLDKRQTRAMVESVTGGTVLPAEVLEQIVAKTDGVPLFVEELTKTVLESGALVADGSSLKATGVLPIPATLQDSLMARLDRSNPVKEIAQIGAAIGREFSYKLLLAVAGMDEATMRAGLAMLEEAELAARRGVPPDATYTFKHALVQDAAYESLLRSRRQTIHGRIAKALRDQFPAIADTEPEIIAHHFAAAGKTRQAIKWWASAGELVLRRSACVEAVGHLEKAIALADSLSDQDALQPTRLRLQTAYANSLLLSRGHVAPETTRAFSRATDLATQLGDQTARFAGLYGIWVSHFSRGNVLQAHDYAKAFLREAKGLRSELHLSIGHRICGSTKWCLGDCGQSAVHLRQACDLYDFDRDAPLIAKIGVDAGSAALIILANALWPLGDVNGARTAAEQALLQAHRIGHVGTIALVHAWSGTLEGVRRDPERAGLHAEALIRIGSEHGVRAYIREGMILGGWVKATAGGRHAGVAEIRERLEFGRHQSSALFDPLFHLLLATTVAEDDLLAGLAICDEKLDQYTHGKQLWLIPEYQRHRGNLLRRLDPSDEAQSEAAYAAALTAARRQKARTFELRASLDLARLYCDTGREREVVPLLQGALVGFTETPELPEIGEARLLLKSLS